jgi:hypothetical protein
MTTKQRPGAVSEKWMLALGKDDANQKSTAGFAKFGGKILPSQNSSFSFRGLRANGERNYPRC